MAAVSILPAEGEGLVTLNTITPADLPWQGEYFRGIPITVKATPSPGYTFERWSDASLPAQAEISLTLNRDLALQAIFSTETDTFFISDLKIGPVTANAATLAWRTNKAAQTQIEYGTTAAYGQQTPWTSAFLTRHEITLSGLTPDTRYHFRLRNRDRQGNEVNSADSVFTTLAFTPARVEIDPHNEWEFFTCRVFNLSEVARLTRVVLTGQEESSFDLFRDGNHFTVTPDLGENNDNLTSREVTLAFAGGLAPGARDSNGEDNDLDWRTRRLQIAVHFDDDNVLTGEAVNEGDTDDGNPDLWAVALSLNGVPEVKRGETSVATRSALPQAFALASNYPNPFNAGTLWPLDLPENGLLRAVIYNVQGQRVAELSDQRWQAGWHTLRWKGKDSAGRTVSSGIYLLRLFFEGESGRRQVVTRRLVFLR
ncbi:MAG: T9SS type A sorting domain-containing protein [candidate division KSB1 bacterium]|nr:T9SS type A sorting domain-containing protein [candidate division KSB1 bacterium]MDZ7276042.1 T9SS type A sorting domain-containing protein [candidate division KSB1 bacterium]MDZ7285676.1 T9SS type A sorting domain-containing protein [candidate division KSB1 bacterium]MDZ7298708.1 T9SS type A sorting domain-containing protein [candidate division KSB1 bacterium]MDZ7307543.1 T9SS type A sorting domain-containing protein [candidate division KSB1 bacterium]